MYEFDEQDWKLLRKRLPGWQERFMEKLLKDYAAIIAGSENPSERFWKLEKRINKDTNLSGVIAREMKRSRMEQIIASLYREGSINVEDLDGFSDGLVERVKLLGGSR